MNFLVILIVFFAFFTQSLAGFGSALIAMPFLIAILGPDVARPAFILVAQTAGLLFMIQYRRDWQFSDIKLALIGTLIGIPVGTWVANIMTEETFMLVLGIILIGYAGYALANFKLPSLHPAWASLFGFFSGLLHSAYNVGGPPLVMYHSTHEHWLARRFKGNTQAIFFVMGFVVIYEHYRMGNITPAVIQNYAIMTPTMAVALLLGVWAEKFIKQDVFRKMVMLLLICIGIKLIFF